MEIVKNVGNFVAFPASPRNIINEGADNYNGLTKREYFASQALCGILASGSDASSEVVARQAVAHANALVEALSEFED